MHQNLHTHGDNFVSRNKNLALLDMNDIKDKTLKPSEMNQAIVITPHVIKTLRALPTEERVAVAAALTGEMLLGTDVGDLRPIENMIYSIIRFYVNQDSARYRDSKQ